MKNLNFKGLVLILTIVMAITGVGLTVYGMQSGIKPAMSDTDRLKAQQLAELANLDLDTVIRLYTVVGDWDKLFRNISIYKQLLVLVEGTGKENQLIALIPKYEAADLYIAYDYFMTNGLSSEKIKDALEMRAKGEDWQVILARFNESKTYKNYQVLAKDELRRLLGKGYLPEDIIQGDNIARAKDLPLEKVLNLKTKGNTWDNIAQSLGYQGKEHNRQFKLNVPGVTITNEKDLASLIAASNQKAKQREKEEENKVAAELGLTDEQMQEYLRQGYSPKEVRNAYKLAQDNNVTPDEILAKKKEGLSWAEFLAAYSEN